MHNSAEMQVVFLDLQNNFTLRNDKGVDKISLTGFLPYDMVSKFAFLIFNYYRYAYIDCRRRK